MEQYVPILIFFIVLVGVFGAVFLLNALLGPKPKNSQIKLEPFECGSDLLEANEKRYQVRFYLIAIQFILFDIEIVMLYPWAVTARQFAAEALAGGGSGMYVYWKGIVFIFILLIGLIYCWKKGALEWK